MSGCDPVTFNNVTSNVFNCMKKMLRDNGISVPEGNSGHISGHGVEGDFNWDGKTKLTIHITDKPWYAPCSTVNGKISDFVHQCGGS